YFRRLGKYLEDDNIWGRVKIVYMRLQHNKWSFCERKLESTESGGALEFDIEHFRPKSSVKAWPTTAIIEKFNLPDNFPKSAGSDNGYYLLPYHPFNYTVACKPCNTYFKNSYFPIRGVRDIKKDEPRNLKSEQAYLVYPIGDFDADPETIIKYEGIFAVPVENIGENYDRARVIIIFFNLNDRDDHISERVEKISHLYQSLENFYYPPSDLHKELAQQAISRLISGKSSHTNCMRSFKRLYESDRDRVLKIGKEIINYLKTIS
ncbi:MAG: hypothetical protein QG657_4295, partial [Acidobacteriota bacterium]|nr:hypothetical protein [Acidobacteriota bacterium]